MARIPFMTREKLSPEEVQYWDAIASTRGRVDVGSPHSLILNAPKLSGHVGGFGAHVRFEGDIPDVLREVVILTTAREIKSQYEFTAHVRMSKEAGLSEKTRQAIKAGKGPEALSGDEALVMRFTVELIRDRKISDAAFNAVRDRFGVKDTLELTGLIGYYMVLGNFLQAFELELGDGVEPELPGGN